MRRTLAPHGRFSLDKWYLDAVSESGETFIGYRADLRWRRIGVSYAATLTGGAEPPRTRQTVRPGEEPDFSEGALAWEEPRLEASANWRGAARPIVRTLHESPEGGVLWSCLLPSADTEIRCGDATVRGLGYAERLTMTLPPWRLPIEALRWGRFLAGAHSVVWIDWRSKNRDDDRTWIFVDGAEVRGEVSEETVLFERGRVELPAAGRLVLRDGRLSRLLRNLPRSLRTCLPAGTLAMNETKWRTRGCLHLEGSASVAGWAIHEIIRWS